jgi:hypothetical protein
MWIVAAVLLLLIPTAAEAADVTVRVRGLSLPDVRTRLVGASGGPAGLFAGGQSFEADFLGLTLEAAQGPDVLSLVLETVALPSGSEVTLDGTLGGAPFKAKWRRDRRDRLDVALRGVPVPERTALLDLARTLLERGVAKLRIDYALADRRVQLEFEEEPFPAPR